LEIKFPGLKRLLRENSLGFPGFKVFGIGNSLERLKKGLGGFSLEGFWGPGTFWVQGKEPGPKNSQFFGGTKTHRGGPFSKTRGPKGKGVPLLFSGKKGPGFFRENFFQFGAPFGGGLGVY